jgi:hypothetical protein
MLTYYVAMPFVPIDGGLAPFSKFGETVGHASPDSGRATVVVRRPQATTGR